MYCSKCGTALAFGVRFCPKCGNQIPLNPYEAQTETYYKYVIEGYHSAKVEVYEGYIIVYYIRTGLYSAINNSTISEGHLIEFSELEASIIGSILRFVSIAESQNVDIPLNSPTDYSIATTIVDFIHEYKNANKTVASLNEKWTKYIGESKDFYIEDQLFTVSVEMDLFNQYSHFFKPFARELADKVKMESSKQIHDLLTFLILFPKIYIRYLDYLINKALDILVAEEIWTIGHDDLWNKHVKEFHLAPDYVDNIANVVKQTMSNNQVKAQAVMSLVPHLVGGGFGFKGAVKGIAAASVFNFARDSAEIGMLQHASQLTPEQRSELYSRIDFDYLTEQTFKDYWKVCFTLTDILHSLGSNVWFPSDEKISKANSIFDNLSNPNFPDERKAEMFIEILKTNPYDSKYHKYMFEKWGENEQTLALNSYFGF